MTATACSAAAGSRRPSRRTGERLMARNLRGAPQEGGVRIGATSSARSAIRRRIDRASQAGMSPLA